MPSKEAVKSYQGIRIFQEEKSLVHDFLVEEQKLEILINGSVFTTTMCSPGMEKELVRGLLHSEDIYRGDNSGIAIKIERIENHAVKAHCEIESGNLGQGYLSGRSLLSVSSCGICGKTELDFLEASELQSESTIPAEIIPSLFTSMEENQHNWTSSGGSHAAAVFQKSGEMLSIAEDIGRHNAVDKAVGRLLLNDELSKADILLVSSRVSYEIVAKCFTSGIPCLAAVSAPSTLAVDFAKELGICLMAFCRHNRFTIYSKPERITFTESAVLGKG
jgi:FdhD protein